MRLLSVGTTFTLDVPVDTVGFLRLRPSDHTPSSEQFTASHGGTTIPIDSLHDVGAHSGSRIGVGQRVERVLLPAGCTTVEYSSAVAVDDHVDAMPANAVAPQATALTASQWWWLQPSRYCRPDELGPEAWSAFGSNITNGHPATGQTVRHICHYVNEQMTFAYGSTTTETGAGEAWRQRVGVCRDFNHIAVSFCRALNIPARYVFGYLPDVDVVRNNAPMDFCAWFEVLLDGRWWAFDARVNEPRIGRIPIARGRDAADVPLVSTLGVVTLGNFVVHASELAAPMAASVGS